MGSDAEKFEIGDLVKCVYDLFDHFDYFLDQMIAPQVAFRGIIIDIFEEDSPGARYGYEKLYVVRCSDGHQRYFACWEIKLLSRNA